MWTPLHRRLHQALRSRCLLPANSHILIAVSGGQDSLTLAQILHDLRHLHNWRGLSVAHCDHAWPGDAGMSAHVERFCARLGLECVIRSARVGEVGRSEDEARRWRYGVLMEMALAGGSNNVVTGHTMSDRAETLLGNLMNGCGGRGLGSMDWVRNLGKDVKLVRPMLDIRRWETENFCKEKGLEVWKDVYNAKWEYKRNRIRGELIPYLERWFNPNVEEALAKTAEILKEDDRYMESKVDGLWETCITNKGECFRVDRSVLSRAPVALQRRLLKRLVNNVGAMGHTAMFKQVEALCRLVHADDGTAAPALPGGSCAFVNGSFITVSPPMNKRQVAV